MAHPNVIPFLHLIFVGDKKVPVEIVPLECQSLDSWWRKGRGACTLATPNHELFNKDVRAFSHGCIRVEKPEELAEWVLGWPAT